jgi:hypothetical protein
VSDQTDIGVRPFGQVRGVFWGLLIVSLVLAMAGPTAVLLRAASTTLEVRACLWPPNPRAESIAFVVVAALDTTDRTALHGPWAQIGADWDMMAMSMGRQHTAIPGPSGSNGVFSVPLLLSMAGSWWARISVRTPGRPTWQAQLEFSVLPAAATKGSPPGANDIPGVACVSRGRG